MKTPKELANDISDNLYDEVFTVLTAKQAEVDALAEALREAVIYIPGQYDDERAALNKARAALAAYDAEAK